MVSLYTLIGLLTRLSPSGSQFLPYRWQTALRSVAADEPHAATIGSTLVRRIACRTTLPPVCGTFHSHSLLQSLPMPTTCHARTEKCSLLRSSRIAYRSTHSPRCRCAASLQLRPSRSIGARKCITCGSRLAIDGVCPSAYAFYVANVGYRLASPRRHPTFATAKPAHPALSVIPIAPCTLIRRRKCLRLRLVARHRRRLRKRIRQSPLQSGIGLLRSTDTRLAFHCVCPMLSQACAATPVPGQWHTLRRQ